MANRGEQLNIAIIGTGSIGAVVGLAAIKEGHHVELVTRDQDSATRLKKNGLRISGFMQGISDNFKALHEIKKIRKPDILFLATKANDVIETAKVARGRIGKKTLVVSLQNGICEELISQVIDMSQIVGCVVGFSATMHDLGVVHITTEGQFIIGHFDNQLQEELPLVQDILKRVVPTEITTNIKGHLYSKLIINSCMNSIGALSGYNLGQMLGKRRIRRIFISLMQEAMTVADAMGLVVEPYGGKLDYYKFSKQGGVFKNMSRHIFMRLMGLKFKQARSSTLASLERGRPTEIDFLNGYIIEQGKKHAVPTPINEQVVALIKQIEEKRRRIDVNNLKEITLN